VTSSPRRTQFETLWSNFEHSDPHSGVIHQDLLIGENRIGLSLHNNAFATTILNPLRSRWIDGDTAPTQIRVMAGPLPDGTDQVVDLRSTSFSVDGCLYAVDDDGITFSYTPEATMLSMWDRQSQRGLFWIRELALLPSWEQSAPLIHLFHWISADHGSALVHAAAVGCDGKGLLIIGPGGTGKSTSAIACLDAGWQYVSDDYTLISNTPVPKAINLYGAGKLSPSSVDYFPSLQRAVVAIRAEDDKTIFDFAAEFPHQIVNSLELVGVVFPHLGATPQPAVRIASIVAAQALVPSTAFQLRAIRPETIGTIGAILRSLPCFSVELGTDRHEAPRQLKQILEEVG